MMESQNIEWKSSWHDDQRKAICGFPNSEGGLLVLGREDNGQPGGRANDRNPSEKETLKGQRLKQIETEMHD